MIKKQLHRFEVHNHNATILVYFSSWQSSAPGQAPIRYVRTPTRLQNYDKNCTGLRFTITTLPSWFISLLDSPLLPDKPPFVLSGHQHDSKMITTLPSWFISLLGSPLLPDKPPFVFVRTPTRLQNDDKNCTGLRFTITTPPSWFISLLDSPLLPDKPPFVSSGHQHDSKMMIKTAQVWGSQSQRYHLSLFLFLAVLCSRTSPHFILPDTNTTPKWW